MLVKLKMKTITSLSTFILLLQCAALPCSARSGRRASPPSLENTLSLSNLNSLNSSLYVFASPLLRLLERSIETDTSIRDAGPADPNLKILSKVPHDEKMGGLTLRITKLKSVPFISSYNILPCMVEMLSTAFNAIWNEAEQHPQLHDNEFRCSENSLTLQVLSHKPPLKGMKYSDLVYLAKMLLNFQQVYRLPGIEFDYLEDGQKTGTGDLNWNYEYAASSVQSLEQE